jgi:hypothetical protein
MAGRTKMSQQAFKPGDTVPDSGIYRAHHANEHRKAHAVVLLSRGNFPVCAVCGKAVRFDYVQVAPHIFDDKDFQ